MRRLTVFSPWAFIAYVCVATAADDCTDSPRIRLCQGWVRRPVPDHLFAISARQSRPLLAAETGGA